MKLKRFLPILLILLTASIASAHPGHGGRGFAAGLQHPFSGLDHLLVMIAVGMWATKLGGRAIWMLPLTFVGVMCLGGVLAKLGIALPAVESTIAASVLILGLVLVVAIKLPTWGAMLLVGLFAVFHGYAHMAEMGHDQSASAYAAGFVIATLTLHAIGILIGLSVRRVERFDAVRWAGAVVALCGIGFCVGIL